MHEYFIIHAHRRKQEDLSDKWKEEILEEHRKSVIWESVGAELGTQSHRLSTLNSGEFHAFVIGNKSFLFAWCLCNEVK